MHTRIGRGGAIAGDSSHVARPPVESSQCAAGALSQTEHMHVIPRTNERTG